MVTWKPATFAELTGVRLLATQAARTALPGFPSASEALATPEVLALARVVGSVRAVPAVGPAPAGTPGSSKEFVVGWRDSWTRQARLGCC